MLKLLPALFIVFLLPIAVFADNLEVSGAGTVGVNGIDIDNGLKGGAQEWIQDGGLYYIPRVAGDPLYCRLGLISVGDSSQYYYVTNGSTCDQGVITEVTWTADSG